MVYARLDVFWPDGKLETFNLEDDTVSVGRAPGNSIPLETDTISRYHFSIVKENDAITITDLESANGTFVDGVRLVGNVPTPLTGVEEIQIGHLRIIYRPEDDTPTLPVDTLADTQPIEMQAPTFRLDLDIPHLNVWPASSSSSELAITNTSDETSTFMIHHEGLPAKWVRLNRTQIIIPAEETAYVMIHIKPPRHPDVKPIEHTLNLTVTPNGQEDHELTVPLEVVVREYRGFGIALANHQIELNETMRLYLHNQGNGDLSLEFKGYDKLDALDYQFAPNKLTLSGGQRSQIKVTVNPKQRHLVGQEKVIPFDLQVISQDQASFILVENGKITIPSRLPAWSLISLAGILVSAFIIMLLAGLGVLAPMPDPNVAQLNFVTQIARGDVLDVEWASTDVAEMVIEVNGTPVTSVVDGSTEFALDTTPYVGNVRIEMVGRNDNTDDESRLAGNVFIYTPLDSETFTFTLNRIDANGNTIVNDDNIAPILFRNVVTTIDINWDINGATLTRVRGLDAFSNALIEESYAGNDSITGISGIPTENFDLIITAQDEIDNVREYTLSVVVIDPTCTTLEAIELREGPDIRHQTIGQVPATETVVVRAQNVDSTWLQVALAGDVLAWGQVEQFECNPSFQISDLRKEVNYPPLPTETPIPTETPEPTLTTAPSETPSPETTPDTN